MHTNIDGFEDSEDYYDDPGTTNLNTQLNLEELEDKWYEIEQEYRERYSDITDEDVEIEPGRFDLTVKQIGNRIGKTPNEIRAEIENW
ncbi:hypothetical protein KO529_14185 [Arenibacter algicola]|uniref:hypothetical protein n=1 Tax=Arenibacter algicola TaxID=616991 RepID=UPI001C06794D|nr:hypothetical protein [Arenibacter algicola]MBU2905944.1 hypothetical protein [Arenibacter algicola]